MSSHPHRPAPPGGNPPAALNPGSPRSATDRIAEFLETYGPYNEESARAEAGRCLQCPETFCVAGCPLGNQIPEWLRLTAEGHFLEAAALTQSANSLPEICGGPCPTDELCQSACVLNGRGEPVAISALARFLNDYAFAHPTANTRPAPPNGLRVAVLGSGPGGLACADELAKHGYAVTVHDTGHIPGGLLAHGAPALQLEPTALQRRIEHLRQRGVVFRQDLRPGVDVTLESLRLEFDAVFLGFGSQQARPLTVPGADLQGVVQALPFLLPQPDSSPVPLPPVAVTGRRVVVLGGGDTAMECLQRARREGATKATGVYRRNESALRATAAHYEAARAAGAAFEFLARPVAVLDAAGQVVGLRCERTTLGAPDATGRPAVTAVPESAFELRADVVVVAFGFEAVPAPFGPELARLAHGADGRLRVDANLMTSEPGVFAGGELVRGPDLVVHDVRDGRRAAAAIHRHLFQRRVSDLGASETDHMGLG
jgi:glutamate synthase (NADPH/NADH) small chain